MFTATLRKIVLGSFIALAGCGSGTPTGSDVCTAKSPCANDPAPTQADIDMCHRVIMDGACGSAWLADFECDFAHHTCDSSGHVVCFDACATACESASRARQACCTAHPTAAGC